MEDLVSNGYADPVPVEELTCTEGKTWYIPHHGVYHPKKPCCVVFDCSAEHKGNFEFEFEWGFYALLASKAIFRGEHTIV